MCLCWRSAVTTVKSVMSYSSDLSRGSACGNAPKQGLRFSMAFTLGVLLLVPPAVFNFISGLTAANFDFEQTSQVTWLKKLSP